MSIKVHLNTKTMKKIFFIIPVFFAGCMALPKQPPLTVRETAYFKELREQCQCFVRREVNPHAIKAKPNTYYKGYYIIVLDSVQCSILDNEDSLKAIGYTIAKKLHSEVLGKDFKYDYDRIIVTYDCYTLPNQGKSQGFEYGIEELETP